MKKILVSDFDGTLYINGKITKKDKEVILDFQKENIFIIASGRTKLSLLRDIDTVKPDYIITNHGAVIYKNNDIILNKTMNKDIKNKCFQIARKYVSDKDIFVSSEKENFDGSITLKNIKDINKIRVYFKTENKREDFINEINNELKGKIKHYKVISFGKLAVEIIETNINKSDAIKFIANKENITKKNIFTIGDNNNDLDMIKNYKGYAIKTAKSIIKENAKEEVNNIYALIKLLDKE